MPSQQINRPNRLLTRSILFSEYCCCCVCMCALLFPHYYFGPFPCFCMIPKTKNVCHGIWHIVDWTTNNHMRCAIVEAGCFSDSVCRKQEIERERGRENGWWWWVPRNCPHYRWRMLLDVYVCVQACVCKSVAVSVYKTMEERKIKHILNSCWHSLHVRKHHPST